MTVVDTDCAGVWQGGDGPATALHAAWDPFARARAMWAGLDWQPGTWWAVDGVG